MSEKQSRYRWFVVGVFFFFGEHKTLPVIASRVLAMTKYY